jgi:hypothetical protein
MSQRSLAPLGILAITLATAFARTAAPVEPDTIIALERGALDRWGRSDPQGYLALYAREVTYFDPCARSAAMASTRCSRRSSQTRAW